MNRLFQAPASETASKMGGFKRQNGRLFEKGGHFVSLLPVKMGDEINFYEEFLNLSVTGQL